jgi:hypothetical protein
VANLIRIVAGVGGMAAAGWSVARTVRRRRDGAAASFGEAFAIMGLTAAVIALTLLG